MKLTIHEVSLRGQKDPESPETERQLFLSGPSRQRLEHVYVTECGAHAGIEMFERDGHSAACSLIVYCTSFSLEAFA